MSDSRTIGVIGAGLLGAAILRRLLAAGHVVLAWDVAADRRQEAAGFGARMAENVAQIAACPRILLCLPTTDIVEQVLAELDAGLAAGHILIDATTGDPMQTAAIGQRLAERGIDYLDATVSGSSAEALAGRALVAAGGDRRAFLACADLFATFAQRVHYCGPCGAGSAMKLASNLVLGLNRAALAEGLALAAALGIDQSQALTVLKESAAYSRAMDAKGEKMVARDFQPQARLAQHLKDVRLLLAAAARSGQPLPLSQVHAQLLEALCDAGYGAEDNAAILRAYDKPPP